MRVNTQLRKCVTCVFQYCSQSNFKAVKLIFFKDAIFTDVLLKALPIDNLQKLKTAL